MKLNFWPFKRQAATLPIETEPAKLPIQPRTYKAWGPEGMLAARTKLDRNGKVAGSNPVTPYVLPSIPPNVRPSAEAKMAMDSACGPNPVGGINIYGWANQFSSAFEEGQLFLGYSIIAALLQRSEYRIPSEAIAEEMTRNWGEVTYTGEDDANDAAKKKGAAKKKEVEDELKRLKIKDLLQEHLYNGEAYGRSQIYIDTGASDNPQELKMPMPLEKTKIGKGKLKNLQIIEPIWTYPGVYNTIDPLQPDYYKPNTWFVLGKEVHHTRLLTTVPHPVSQILKPAYMFGGLSMTQMMKPYVDNWLQTRQSVNEIVQDFSTSVLSTNLNTLVQGNELLDRLQTFVLNRTNQGVFAIDKDTEEFSNVSAPLSSLDKLQAQAQEHMASPARMPLVKLLGITPTGLNASTEGEMQAYRETMSAKQENIATPIMDSIMQLVQFNLWGDIDPAIGWKWNPIKHLDRVEEATAEKAEAETDSIRINDGVISPGEVRTKLANDENSQYHGIDPNDVPEPPESDMEGMGEGQPFNKQEKV